MVFLGSPVSVNDPLPWIAQELALIRLAFKAGIPILGICFGGQLISKALGGEVNSAPMMQIGWHRTTLSEHAKELFKSRGGLDSFSVFEWHGDKFSLPKGPCLYSTGSVSRIRGFSVKIAWRCNSIRKLQSPWCMNGLNNTRIV